MFDELTGELPPRERGWLLAHQISAGPAHVVRSNLDAAKRRRRALLSWLLPGRRLYLDGLIRGLEKSLHDRALMARHEGSGSPR